MSSPRKDREFVTALANGMRIIEAFDADHTDMTLSQVAQRTALSPATARRGLHTLASLGYARLVKGRYLLSARILALGSAYLRSSMAEDLLGPELRSLVEKTGDTAGIGVLVGGNVLYIAYHCIPRGIRPVAEVGVTFPAFATSMGRILLSGLPEAALDSRLRHTKLERFTDLTETDPRRLKSVLKRARKDGYTTICDELIYGITSLAVPIVDSSGTIVAALNTSGYSGLITTRRLVDERLPHLIASATRISRLMMRHPALLHSFVTEPDIDQTSQRPAPKGAALSRRRQAATG